MPDSFPDIDWNALERSLDLGGQGRGDGWLTDVNDSHNQPNESPAQEIENAAHDDGTLSLEEVKKMVSPEQGKDEDKKSKLDKIKEEYSRRPYVLHMGQADLIETLHKNGFGPKEIADSVQKKFDIEVSPEQIAAHLRSAEEMSYEQDYNPYDINTQPSVTDDGTGGGPGWGGGADRVTTTSLITSLRKTAERFNFRGNFKLALTFERLADILE